MSKKKPYYFRHDGSDSIWRMVLSEEELDAYLSSLQSDIVDLISKELFKELAATGDYSVEY
ncbi:hypothetical protein [Vibrio phage JSF12]|uniref:Uncharacterized protein n=2 Tax=Jesfedecavirus TaxID=2560156 RepID=A0A2D0YLM7_9CAUD|nr:hypothetical protein FDI98_gp010 [Vibrio phage JSF10]YP_009794734.1 hypothetical protein HOS35_gp051 [Vibrio phage JSF12]ASV43379.1 hypothetical protein [Vibrio phage JSF10]ASV43569.1 hypothetical protein [Vibrio phage JSF12]